MSAIHLYHLKYNIEDKRYFTIAGALIYGAITAAVAVGTTAYSSAVDQSIAKKQMNAERENQDKLIAAQEKQVADAEAKSAAAEALAKQEATDTMRKRRLAQTQTILTSPLGINDTAEVGKKTLLGG